MTHRRHSHAGWYIRRRLIAVYKSPMPFASVVVIRLKSLLRMVIRSGILNKWHYKSWMAQHCRATPPRLPEAAQKGKSWSSTKRKRKFNALPSCITISTSICHGVLDDHDITLCIQTLVNFFFFYREGNVLSRLKNCTNTQWEHVPPVPTC